MLPRTLHVRGAEQNNLAGVNVSLSPQEWTAVVGLSGSGKTSLVFDVIAAEGRRRFLSGLSPRARRSLGKLGGAEVASVDGLPAVLVVEVGGAPHARSTFGTLSGTLSLLRLLFARGAVNQHDKRQLTMGDFSSIGHGACAECGGLGTTVAVDPTKLVRNPSASLRDGALHPTLKNGYTVYSQVTLEVMERLAAAHGFSVHAPWEGLTDAQRHMVFYGTDVFKVPFGKHSIESRLKWEGITAKPREEGYYRGIVPVIADTLKRSRNPNILKYASTVSCESCEGSGLSPTGRLAQLGEWTLPDVLAVPCREIVERLVVPPALESVKDALAERVRRLVGVGLGHLAVGRPASTLSGGERQRARLVAQLGSGLSGFLVALDEPTLGLHRSSVPGMVELLEGVLASGNGLVVVEHDPEMMMHADRVIELGPGAGPAGGNVVSDGTASQPFPTMVSARATRNYTDFIDVVGATLHNLDGVSVSFARGALNVVHGPSGAGKSSLVLGCLLPAAQGKEAPVQAVRGLDGVAVLHLNAAPIGKTSRSTPATYTGLFDQVRKRFATASSASGARFTASMFSYNTRGGRCESCDGLGFQRIGMHLLADIDQPCVECGGHRYGEEVQAVKVRGASIADVLGMTVDAALAWAEEPALRLPLQAMQRLGLGYLQLGRPSSTLSRGEAQRIRLAALLGAMRPTPTLVLLDEPDRGLHPADLARLVDAARALTAAGHTLVAISHHPHLIDAADHTVCLVDGSVADGVPYVSREPRAHGTFEPVSCIRLAGVRTHNLHLDVSIQHKALTVISGRSGSGKSSLAAHTLVAEAYARFAQSLPFEVARHTALLPRPPLDSATGLGPTLWLAADPPTLTSRSTVGTQTELGALLRLFAARCNPPLTAEHFSPNRPLGACSHCAGSGRIKGLVRNRFVSDESLPLFAGALAGTRPGRHFGESGGRFEALLRASLPGVDFDVPFSELPAAARQKAFDGCSEAVQTVWKFERGANQGEHALDERWVGFNALVLAEAKRRAKQKAAAEWAEPLGESACSTCTGSGLRAEIRDADVEGHRFGELLRMPCSALLQWLSSRESLLGKRIFQSARSLLEELDSLGLGHLCVGQSIPDLTPGEFQRVRLAAVLSSGLTALTLVLDEPDQGLSGPQIAALMLRLRASVDAGNTVVVVSHAGQVIAAADDVIELANGRIARQGAPLAQSPIECRLPGPPSGPLVLGSHRLPRAGLIGISERPELLREARLLPFDVVWSPVLSGRTVGDVLGVHSSIARVLAKRLGLPRAALSFRSSGGCSRCKGTGVLRVSLEALPDVVSPCELCEGMRFTDPVARESVGAMLQRPLGELAECEVPAVATKAPVMQTLGLGHLSLGRTTSSLSTGERRRLPLANLPAPGALLLLRGPTAGLHHDDLPGVLGLLRARASTDLVLVASQRHHVLAEMDALIR